MYVNVYTAEFVQKHYMVLTQVHVPTRGYFWVSVRTHFHPDAIRWNVKEALWRWPLHLALYVKINIALIMWASW